MQDVVQDVRLAILEGRTSLERPGFLRTGAPAYRGSQWCWNAARTRAYLVREVPSTLDSHRFIVITALAPEQNTLGQALGRRMQAQGITWNAVVLERDEFTATKKLLVDVVKLPSVLDNGQRSPRNCSGRS